MIYLPDTNACVQFLRGRDEALVSRWLEEAPSLRLSAIVVAELHYGVAKLALMEVPAAAKTREGRRVEQLVGSLPCERFTEADAVAYGRLRARLERQGAPVGPSDLLIAAQALRLRAVLVTHNTAEFARVPDLKIEDWQAR